MIALLSCVPPCPVPVQFRLKPASNLLLSSVGSKAECIKDPFVPSFLLPSLPTHSRLRSPDADCANFLSCCAMN